MGKSPGQSPGEWKEIMNKSNGVGIASYGAQIPQLRITVEEILKVWSNFFLEILKEQLMISERAVLLADQDTTTMAVEASRQALARSSMPVEKLGALLLGTCTNPYDSRPSATLIAEALGTSRWLQCNDVQFSTKSGTSALQFAAALISCGAVNYAMAIGSDSLNRHTAPGTLQEYSASSAAAAYLLSDNPDEIIASIGPFTSCVSDLSDFFRLGGERYIRSGGISSQESGIGFLDHIAHAVRRHFDTFGLGVSDFDYVVFQQPVGVVPVALALKFGFGMEQVTQGLVAYDLGDLGSASVGIGLASILDQAEPGQKILLASYGFGAGADVTVIETTDNIRSYNRRGRSIEGQIQNKVMIDYATAMKYEQKYAKVEHALTAWS
jgi:2-acetylphloroglucinol acetyltransferase